jgi:hypothetical protein
MRWFGTRAGSKASGIPRAGNVERGWHVGCDRRAVAILAPLLAFIGRQIGRLVQMIFGWATVLLFGRVPQSKQLLLAGVALGSILWVVALIGIAFPDFGAFLIALVPAPDFIDDDVIRIVMLVLAIILPLLVGAAGLFLMDPADRPPGIGGKVKQVLRGYPYAAVLAIVIVFLAIVAPIFKVRTIIKRWEDAHVPIVVKPGGYDQVAGELEQALDAAGLDLDRSRAPRVLEMPSRLLATVGGESVKRLVPDELAMLKSKALEVSIYPSDVAIAGTKEQVARARAAIADRLTQTEAHLTASKEAQELEDVIKKMRKSPDRQHSLDMLPGLDQMLAHLTIPYEEWEVLYRQRLQVERDLLRASSADAPPGAE